MESKINQITEKIDKIDDKIDKILAHSVATDVTLAGQAADIKYHIMRTDLLQEAIVPIQKHVHMIEGGFKIIGYIATAVTFLGGIYKMFTMIGH